MAEGLAKKKNIYIEGMITTIILLGGPFLVQFIFKYFYSLFEIRGNKELEIKFFSYLICVLFDFTFVISSGLSEPFEVVKNRLSDLFDVVFIIKIKDSFKAWLIDIKEKGFFFWIYLGLIINHLYILIDCLLIYFKIK